MAAKKIDPCVLVAGAAGAMIGGVAAYLALKSSSTPSLENGLKLQYFDLPALGEPARILLALSGKEWIDERLSREAWKALKSKSKYGQMPLLTNKSGKALAQSTAITRYLAKFVTSPSGGSPLYPTCPCKAALVDELIETFNDLHKNFYKIKNDDEAAKLAERGKYLKGDGAKLLAALEGSAGEWMVGDSMTLADVWVFYFLSFYLCGFWDGVPKDTFDCYPKMMAIRKKVASIPALKKYYTDLGKATWQGVSYDSFLASA